MDLQKQYQVKEDAYRALSTYIGKDEYFVEAAYAIFQSNKTSIGTLQRVLRIGFYRASNLMDQLIAAGVVSQDEGIKPRDLLMTMDEFKAYLLKQYYECTRSGLSVEKASTSGRRQSISKRRGFMTIGEVYEKGMLGDKDMMMGLDTISMLCLYRIVQTEAEYELLFPTSLSEQNVGERILRDMQSFRYFKRKKVFSSQQVLEYLYKIKIHPSIWRNKSWLSSKIPGAYVKRGFLYYKENRDGKDVEVKVWLYSKKLLSAKPKTFVESMLDELKIVD